MDGSGYAKDFPTSTHGWSASSSLQAIEAIAIENGYITPIQESSVSIRANLSQLLRVEDNSRHLHRRPHTAARCCNAARVERFGNGTQ
jgi:hypothetical protein